MYFLAAADHRRKKYVSIVLSLESVSLMWLPSNNGHPTGAVAGGKSFLRDTCAPLFSYQTIEVMVPKELSPRNPMMAGE